MANTSNNWAPDRIRDVAADYSLGLADPADVISFEMLLEAGNALAINELAAFEETAARLGAASQQSPPPSLRAKVLQSLAKPVKKPKLLAGFEEPIPGFHLLRSGSTAFRPTGMDGIESMLLSRDPASEFITILLRMAPGASLPRHSHSKEEQCWVLEGDVSHVNCEIEMRAGDFIRAMPGTEHSSITTKNGCLLLLVASAHDQQH